MFAQSIVQIKNTIEFLNGQFDKNWQLFQQFSSKRSVSEKNYD